jgi:hypothetical protein
MRLHLIVRQPCQGLTQGRAAERRAELRSRQTGQIDKSPVWRMTGAGASRPAGGPPPRGSTIYFLVEGRGNRSMV